MYYISTRGDKTPYKASDAIIKGLAEDGGLFVPDKIPCPYSNIEELNKLASLDYKQLAYEVMKHFISGFTEEELKSCIEKAYDEKFDDELIAPLVKTGGIYFLELFHGKTLAFKDMALSILPHFMKTALNKKRIKNHVLILTATSGDTGKAAMEGFKDVDGISVMVFYPKDGVSKVQELQMTTQQGNNITAAAIKGNFDDCQGAVKSIFSDKELVKAFEDKGVILSSANSINIGRLIPQTVYYFYAYMQLALSGEITIGEEVNICVPSGNFGNILAAYYAKMMGLPVKKLICASNENNVLYDFISTGNYDANRSLMTTISPSMDIIVSSNLERLLYHAGGNSTKELMERLVNNRKYSFNNKLLKDNGFCGGWAAQSTCLEAISQLYEETGYIMDTHTAVAYIVGETFNTDENDDTALIVASTASPYKFPASVMEAINGKVSKLDDFKLIKELAFLLAEEPPAQIRDLDKKDVIHTDICGKGEIKDYVINKALRACL